MDIFDVEGVIIFSEQTVKKEDFFKEHELIVDQPTNDLFFGVKAKGKFQYLIHDDVKKCKIFQTIYTNCIKLDCSIDYRTIFNLDILGMLKMLSKRLAIASSGIFTNIDYALRTNYITLILNIS